MPLIDTNVMEPRERLPGWHGHIFHSASMTFAHWRFAAGAAIHEHWHEQEEVWHVIEGELELTIAGEIHRANPGCVAIVPPNTPHFIRALTNGMAIVADHPIREGF